MRVRIGFVLAVAVLAACGHGQRAKREWLFLLPAAVKPEVTEDEARLLPVILRGVVVGAFEERNMPAISPVQMQVTEREWAAKLSDTSLWTTETYAKLAERWKARYFANVTLVELETVEGAVESLPPNPPPPGGQLRTTAKIVGSLYDVATKKYIFENKESVVTLKVGRPGPSDQQIQNERRKAVAEAGKALFKDFLKKFPMKPPAVGLGAGGVRE